MTLRSFRVLRPVGHRLPTVLLAACGMAIVALVWQVTASASNASQVPAPADVWRSLTQDWHQIPALSYLEFQSGGIRAAVAFSTAHVLVGVAVGTAVGLPLGIALARVRLVRLLLAPPLSLLGTLPLLVLLPFITLWFGTAGFAQSGLVMLFACLTVAFAAESAAVTVSDHYANYASALGASRTRILWTVVLPAAGPTVIGAIRVALAAGWSWQAVAELLGAHHGVGRVIDASARLGAVSDIAATVLCLAAVAVICDAVVARVGGVLVRWKPS
jgi:ABC-type nitrate/sulfonate/bicarbonate transport system permease component